MRSRFEQLTIYGKFAGDPEELEKQHQVALAAHIEEFLRESDHFRTDAGAVNLVYFWDTELVIKFFQSHVDKSYLPEMSLAEHQLFAADLSGFVPPTVFLTMQLGAEKEWIAVQEQVHGVNYMELRYKPVSGVSAELEAEFREFQDRYRRVRNQGYVPEDQFMVDFSKDKIWIYDTNLPYARELLFHVPTFFSLFPAAMPELTAESILDFLYTYFPFFKQYDLTDEEVYLEIFSNEGGDVFSIFYQQVLEIAGDKVDSLVIENELLLLFWGLSYFPPSIFLNNKVTKDFARGLGLPMNCFATPCPDFGESD